LGHKKSILIASENIGMWIEFGLFCLVLVFSLHQFYDLKKEKQKREAAKKQGLGLNNKTTDK
jgi:hypothetical protein